MDEFDRFAEMFGYEERFGPRVASGETPMGRWAMFGRVEGERVYHGVMGPGGGGGGGRGLLPFQEHRGGVMGHFGALSFSGVSLRTRPDGTLVANLNRNIHGAVAVSAERVEVVLSSGVRVEGTVVDVGSPLAKLFVAFWDSGEEWIRLVALDGEGVELGSRVNDRFGR